VAADLRSRLSRDSKERLYVDVLLITHPDKDHCTGLKKHFHMGPPDNWSEAGDKILVHELWSSPMVFRRASAQHVLCSDAMAFNTEARRRVQVFRDANGLVIDGDRILILGEDEDGKTDDLSPILVRADATFSTVNGQYDSAMTARLLAPQPKSDDSDEEEVRSKNHSSTILNFSLAGDGVADVCRFLSGGDAEVAIWERLWQRHAERADWFSYDVLQAPHHCSWHSLSYDSWSEYGEEAEVCADARSALAQARKGAVIVASSKAIKDDDVDPPCIRAKREYQSIAKNVGGSFVCGGEPEKNPDVVEFEIGKNGPRLLTRITKAAVVTGSGAIGRQPLPHG
jgi:hypothetical protein